MAKGEIVKPREIVKANNELFRCKYKLKDIVAGRIFMSFASLVDHRDVKENENFLEYRISANTIVSENCGGSVYQQLLDAARILLKHTIEQFDSKNKFVAYTLFSKIEYENGILTGQFHKDLVPFFLVAKERFTKLKLTEYMQLPSIYSQSMFGFLKSWSDKSEITISVKKLHEMLDTPESVRKNFSEFKRRVLEKAHKDINEHTSLAYEWEPIKDGRSFSEIRFKFIRKPKGKATDAAAALMKNALGVEPPERNNKIALAFNHFLDKFSDRNAHRFTAFPVWTQLNEKSIAPLATDVPDNNELGVMEFLAAWQQSHVSDEA